LFKKSNAKVVKTVPTNPDLPYCSSHLKERVSYIIILMKLFMKLLLKIFFHI